MERRLLSPEEIASQAGSGIPFLVLPARGDVFRARADRLRQLAPDHAMSDYLRFIAHVADAQQRSLDTSPPFRLPPPSALDACREHGMPPLNVQTHARDPLWRDELRRLLRDVADAATGRQREIVVALELSRDELYEAQASKLVAGVTLGLDTATAPLIAAGLQVYFTHLALALGEQAIVPTGVATLCPCCASRPTAGVLRVGGASSGYRFLHCSMCSAQWHMVRVKCASCEGTKGISYLALDDGGPPGRRTASAEVCDECGSYLKLLSMESDPGVDAVADDLATLALDLLVSETGRSPCGVNFMLLHGDSEAES
ncbi:MAG TPA: formate dehydrogenase accessory protein FdhE [Casimicrobiaceae bacterium]|nr:formate dehydrogenase accessory protein FdhE [Casimicrobiaceae bacterium]